MVVSGVNVQVSGCCSDEAAQAVKRESFETGRSSSARLRFLVGPVSADLTLSWLAVVGVRGARVADAAMALGKFVHPLSKAPGL